MPACLHPVVACACRVLLCVVRVLPARQASGVPRVGVASRRTRTANSADCSQPQLQPTDRRPLDAKTVPTATNTRAHLCAHTQECVIVAFISTLPSLAQSCSSSRVGTWRRCPTALLGRRPSSARPFSDHLITDHRRRDVSVGSACVAVDVVARCGVGCHGTTAGADSDSGPTDAGTQRHTRQR